MDSGFNFFFYLIVKFIAYAAWCRAGLRWLWQRDSFRAGLGFGFLRLLLGVFFGVGIFVVGGMMHLEVPAHPVLLYLSIYAPIRYVEWSILFILITRLNAVPGPSGLWRRQAWILGGIVVSHLADLPLILTSYDGAKGFLPVGRFLC